MRVNTTPSPSVETTSDNYSSVSNWTAKVLQVTSVKSSDWPSSTETFTQARIDNENVVNYTATTNISLLSMNSTNSTATPDPSGACSDWVDVQHALFQLANLCLVLSFLTPSSFQHHTFFLRFILGFGYLFFSVWAGAFVCMPDVLIWNCVCFVVNLAHFCYLAYRMFPTRFRSELDELYSKVFKPLKVSRQQFHDLSDIGELYVLTQGTVYAKEGGTAGGQKLSILVKGRYDHLPIVIYSIYLDIPARKV